MSVKVAMSSLEGKPNRENPNFPQVNKRWRHYPRHAKQFFVSGNNETALALLTGTSLTLVPETNKSL